MSHSQLKSSCDKLFRQIDRRHYVIPTSDFLSTDFILIYNCRLMKEYLDGIIDFAPDYDFPKCPGVNGYWSWVRVGNNFASRVLDSFSKKGILQTLQDERLIKISLILLSSLEILFRIRADSLAQVYNSQLLIDSSSLLTSLSKEEEVLEDDRKTTDSSDGCIPRPNPVRRGPLPPPDLCPRLPRPSSSLSSSSIIATSDSDSNDWHNSGVSQGSRYHSSSSNSSRSLPSTKEVSLFSLYESCLTEAILVYNQAIEDPSLGMKEKISLWATFLSLLSDKGFPFEEAFSKSRIRLHENLAWISNGLLSNSIVSTINDRIFSIPYIQDRIFFSKKTIQVSGSEWVVNSGQKKQVYRREDYNEKFYNFDYHQVSCLSSSSPMRPTRRKKLIIFCKESILDNSFDLVSDLAIPSIEILCEQSDSNPFPSCLQQLLDLYVWVHGKNAHKVLGFRPEDITIIGHGFGGSTIISLCLVLHEIRQMKKPSDILMPYPSSIVTIGSSFMTKLLVTPSSLFSFGKSFNGNLIKTIQSRIQLDCLSSAVPWVPKAARRSTLSIRYNVDSLFRGKMVNIDMSSNSSTSLQLVSRAYLEANLMVSMVKGTLFDMISGVKNVLPIPRIWPIFTSIPHGPSSSLNHIKKLLYPSGKSDEDEDDDDDDEFFYETTGNVEKWREDSLKTSLANDSQFNLLKEQLTRFNAVSSNPFISPLLFDDFHSLKTINLHLITSNFSSELDDNVTLARCWKGNVSLHVIDDNIVDELLHAVHGSKVLRNNFGHGKVSHILKESFVE